MAAPFAYRAQVWASTALLPFVARREVNKLRRAGFSVDRAHERLGHATARRTGLGPLVWLHTASLDKSRSLLWLTQRMGAVLPHAQFLLTTDTASSAQSVARGLPPRTTHQFAPLPAPGPLNRFLKTWQPDAAIFAQTAPDPQMVHRAHASGTRMGLVNMPLADQSLAYWKKRPVRARHLFAPFDLILAQSDRLAQAMVDSHAPPDRVARGMNLAPLSTPQPMDANELAKVRAALGNRPVWVATATHKGEEEVVVKAHQRLLKAHPDLCLILSPHDAARGTDARDVIALAGLSYTRRTRGEAPGGQVYLADTEDEQGLWYALTDVAFVGGSLRPVGGHNPFHAAQAGTMVLSGNHVARFADTYAEMEAAGAARIVADAKDLANQVAALLDDDHNRTKARAAAENFIASQQFMLDELARRLIAALGLAR